MSVHLLASLFVVFFRQYRCPAHAGARCAAWGVVFMFMVGGEIHGVRRRPSRPSGAAACGCGGTPLEAYAMQLQMPLQGEHKSDFTVGTANQRVLALAEAP